ncbi:hypothetical protein [Afipia carboxidovorans]|nr:hypothetical protein [Afipia carboxidovorans]
MNEQLKDAYFDALKEQIEWRKFEHDQKKGAQDFHKIKHRLTPFDNEVAECIFNAGTLAMQDSEQGIAQYRVVSAPTGSGKSSFAQAFIKGYLATNYDASVLYLVETIDQAEDVFNEMSNLLDEDSVAVWTSAHDWNANTSEDLMEEYGFIPTMRFKLEELGSYPVAIVTHNFYRGSRADQAVVYKGRDRKLIFVDEKMADVSLYDVDTGLVKTVRDGFAESYSANIEGVAQLTRLHNHLENIWQSADNKRPYDVIAPAELSWFLSDAAKRYLLSPDDRVKSVFGFGRALAQGFAFLSRYDQNGKGARFIGYEMTMPLRPGTILLDATADIDGVSLIANNREPVPVPQVDFRNLSITHIDPPFSKNARISQIVKDATKAKAYAEWIWNTVIENTEVGERVLVVVHKAMLDLEFLPHLDLGFDEAPLITHGARQVRLINWGSGIGSNRWKDADAVFLFGDFHLPKRAIIGTALGLKEQRADNEALAQFQSPKSQASELLMLGDGHLCRHQKQLAMRGNARNISWDGTCGVQRLYITGALKRLIRYKDVLFPGATVKVREPEKRLNRGGRDALVALLYGSTNDVITTIDVKYLTGIDLRKNKNWYLESAEVVEAMRQQNWHFQPGKGGRGKTGQFVRLTKNAA